MKFVYMSALLSLFLLSGCSNGQIIVTDELGQPIQDVEIYSVSLTINSGPVKTDASGVANLQFNIQKTINIRAEKAGYQSVSISAPSRWPLKIILQTNHN